MKLWSWPDRWYQWPLFLLGVILFWSIFLVYFIMVQIIPKWKMDLFILIHIQAIFYNPWLLKEFFE